MDIVRGLEDIGIELTDSLSTAIATKQLNRIGAGGSFSAAYSASGNLANSVELRMTALGFEIWANDYLYYGERGRRNGKRPPVNAIKEWLQDKGIQPTDITLESLAFLIARKIGESGTTIFQAGGSDLVSDVFSDVALDSVEAELADLFMLQIESEIELLV